MFTILAAALASISAPAHLERSIEPSRDAQSRDAQSAVPAPRPLPNGWRYEEPGNNCTLTATFAGTWVQLRLTRWRDLSDSILFHRPGLTPLWSEEGHPSGRTETEEAADAEAGYRLEARIDGRPVEPVIAFNSMLLDHGNRPGPTYRFGIRQQPFLRALARGRILTLHRAGRQLASVPITGLAATARRMAACAAQPTR